MVIVTVFEVPEQSAIRPYRVLGPHKGHIFGVFYGPSGECPGTLLDVVLRVVAHTHREQLQDFPPVVLIDGPLVVRLIVQPDDHRGVLRELYEEVV